MLQSRGGDWCRPQRARVPDEYTQESGALIQVCVTAIYSLPAMIFFFHCGPIGFFHLHCFYLLVQDPVLILISHEH